MQPLSEVLGARIEGIDLTRMDAAQFAAAEEALHEHGFIVFPSQQLTASDLVAFARRWGPPEPHVIDTFHHPDDANILVLSNIVRDGRPMGLADAGTYFHSDYSYLDVPARCTILHALEMPRANHGTTFANQRRAYEELPDATKRRLQGLVARHHYGNRDDLDEGSRTAASPLSGEQKKKVTWVRHPVVRPHPRTGHPALYAVSGSSFGIEGMADTEAVALLDELKAHATAARYRYAYEYAVGDVIVWDNAQLLHAAPLPEYGEARTLWRVTVKES
ncbi:MAG TPA: TauD/TfdA family dioxygenase [Usitatibacter sp.]|nr:TauD/TfdA family dioxygenase [Usitatibacter sp.]